MSGRPPAYQGGYNPGAAPNSGYNPGFPSAPYPQNPGYPQQVSWVKIMGCVSILSVTPAPGVYPQQYYPPGPPVYVHQQPVVVIQQQQPGVVIQQQAPPVVVNETVVVGGRRPTVVVEEKVVVRERPRVRSFSWKNIFM